MTIHVLWSLVFHKLKLLLNCGGSTDTDFVFTSGFLPPAVLRSYSKYCAQRSLMAVLEDHKGSIIKPEPPTCKMCALPIELSLQPHTFN